ncbi:MAG: hypothetical protein Q9181_002651 [Wetmoreana brouardii]
MSPETRIACRACQALLVKESVQNWKDLPSENWAEMMDFWHCHKPDTDDVFAHQTSGVHKGYGAANSIEPTAGIGLVDITCLLMMQQDCNVMYGESSTTGKNQKSNCAVMCAVCKHPVGVAAGVSSANLKLYKWSLQFRRDSANSWEEPTVQKLVSAQLLAMIESQGIQKFVIHSEDSDTDIDALLVWIFTPKISFSSTLVPEGPKQAMKVYYKMVSNPTEVLEQQNLKADDVPLPGVVYVSLRSILRNSTQLLPVLARRFQGWDVGLLER